MGTGTKPKPGYSAKIDTQCSFCLRAIQKHKASMELYEDHFCNYKCHAAFFDTKRKAEKEFTGYLHFDVLQVEFEEGAHNITHFLNTSVDDDLPLLRQVPPESLEELELLQENNLPSKGIVNV